MSHEFVATFVLLISLFIVNVRGLPCSTIPDIENGKLRLRSFQSSAAPGDRIVFGCDYGFINTTELTVTCSSFSEWTNFPTCITLKGIFLSFSDILKN